MHSTYEPRRAGRNAADRQLVGALPRLPMPQPRLHSITGAAAAAWWSSTAVVAAAPAPVPSVAAVPLLSSSGSSGAVRSSGSGGVSSSGGGGSGAGGSSGGGDDRDERKEGDESEDDAPAPLPLPPSVAANWQHALSAIGAGVLTAVFTSPFDVIRTRLAVQQSRAATSPGNGAARAGSSQVYHGLIGSCRTTIREEGVRGLVRQAATTGRWDERLLCAARLAMKLISAPCSCVVFQFRGFGATIVVVPSFWVFYFVCYQDFKKRLAVAAEFPDRHPVLAPVAALPLWATHIVAACSAGAVADVVVNPLFVVRTRLQTQHMRLLHGGANSAVLPLASEAGAAGGGAAAAPKLYTSTWSTLVRLVREEGWMSLFRGVSASLLGLSHVALQFPLYEWMKTAFPEAREAALQRAQGKSPAAPASGSTSIPLTPTLSDLIAASALSKMLASALTFPHEVLRARMQHAPVAVFSSLRDCATKTVANEGWAALYKGFTVNLVRTVPGAALTLVSYELFLGFFSSRYPPQPARF